MPSTAYDFLAERHHRVAGALDRNMDVAKFVQAVLEHLIDRCEARGIKPEDLQLEPVQVIRKGNSHFVSARIR